MLREVENLNYYLFSDIRSETIDVYFSGSESAKKIEPKVPKANFAHRKKKHPERKKSSYGKLSKRAINRKQNFRAAIINLSRRSRQNGTFNLATPPENLFNLATRFILNARCRRKNCIASGNLFGKGVCVVRTLGESRLHT